MGVLAGLRDSQGTGGGGCERLGQVYFRVTKDRRGLRDWSLLKANTHVFLRAEWGQQEGFRRCRELIGN